MLEFTLLAVDTLLQSYSQSLIVVMLGCSMLYVCRPGIALRRTVLEEKKVETVERSER